jgi:hypothetical protein
MRSVGVNVQKSARFSAEFQFLVPPSRKLRMAAPPLDGKATKSLAIEDTAPRAFEIEQHGWRIGLIRERASAV